MKNEIFSKLNFLGKKYNLDLFILFGSRALNSHTINSDYDFAFFKKGMSSKKEYALFNDIMSIIKTENIDLINIEKNTDVTLRKEIFTKGVCLYEKNKNMFLEWCSDALLDYFDFKELNIKRSTSLTKKEILSI